MKLNLTKDDAQEIKHKLGVLADTLDLCKDYGLSSEQADALVRTVPHNGGEWRIAPECLGAVIGEISDHAVVLRNIAEDARACCEDGQCIRIHKQAKRFEGFAKFLGKGIPK